jgi:hypothetical protein
VRKGLEEEKGEFVLKWWLVPILVIACSLSAEFGGHLTLGRIGGQQLNLPKRNFSYRTANRIRTLLCPPFNAYA